MFAGFVCKLITFKIQSNKALKQYTEPTGNPHYARCYTVLKPIRRIIGKFYQRLKI